MAVTIYEGDVLGCLGELRDESVHCCVTSPPYWGLRDYGTAQWEGGDPGCDHKVRANPHIESSGLSGGKGTVGHSREGFKNGCPRCGAIRVDNQIGLESTIEEYIEKMVGVFREVRRVLRADGTCWINLGDSYAANRGYQVPDSKHVDVGNSRGMKAADIGLKPKDLCGVPWRLALALQADGWWLRSDIIWSKANPMPSSVTDRPSTSHEYIFLLTKSARYFYDAEAVKEVSTGQNGAAANFQRETKDHLIPKQSAKQHRNDRKPTEDHGTRNLRSVWTIATAPFPQAHFATFPPAIPERCIKAGTSERGCCGICGTPWKRVVEKTYLSPLIKGDNVPIANCFKGDKSNPRERAADGTFLPRPYASKPQSTRDTVKRMGDGINTITTGWAPTCTCEEGYWEKEHGVFRENQPYDPIPCTVLDPFSGAGTTALVAAKLGRDAIGIELNPEYVEMSRKRIAGEMGMLCEVSIEKSKLLS